MEGFRDWNLVTDPDLCRIGTFLGRKLSADDERSRVTTKVCETSVNQNSFEGMTEENELQFRSHRTRTPNPNHRHLRICNWESSYFQVSQTDLPCRLVGMSLNAQLQLGIFWSLSILSYKLPGATLDDSQLSLF